MMCVCVLMCKSMWVCVCECVCVCVCTLAAVQEAQMLSSAVGLVNICVSCDSGGPPRVRPSVSHPQTSFSSADSRVSASLLLPSVLRSVVVCLLGTAGSSVLMKQSHHPDNSVSGWMCIILHNCSDTEQLCLLMIMFVCAFVINTWKHELIPSLLPENNIGYSR